MTQCLQQIKGMKIKEGVVVEEELLDSKRDLKDKTIKYSMLTLDPDSNKPTIKNNLGKNLGNLMD